MSESSGAVPGVTGIYLYNDKANNAVVLRCHAHPQLNDTFAFGDTEEVPATLLVHAISTHVQVHVAEAAKTAETGTGNATQVATASPLDAFGQEVVKNCIWAIRNSQGDPDPGWPVLHQIAAALALGNDLYLATMGDGPGYTQRTAEIYLLEGLAHPPANLRAWIDAVRAEVAASGALAGARLRPPRPSSFR